MRGYVPAHPLARNRIGYYKAVQAIRNFRYVSRGAEGLWNILIGQLHGAVVFHVYVFTLIRVGKPYNRIADADTDILNKFP